MPLLIPFIRVSALGSLGTCKRDAGETIDVDVDVTYLYLWAKLAILRRVHVTDASRLTQSARGS